MEKLLTVTDKSALRLGVSAGQFLGEAESNTEFEQVFGKGQDRACEGPWKAAYPLLPVGLLHYPNQMSEYIKISYEDWEATYKPIDNPFASDEQLFQIPCSDEETTFLKNAEKGKIWSYGSGEYGGTYIWSGETAQGLESLGAYVTEVAYEGDSIAEIEVFKPEYTCPQCEVTYVGELAVEQRKNFEDSCEECETILTCNTCDAEVGRDENCPNGCDAVVWDS